VVSNDFDGEPVSSPRRTGCTKWPWALLGLLAGLAGLPHSSWADQDPRWRWQTIETDHFRIHFYEGLEDAAHRIAAIAEVTHTRLSAVVGWDPPRTTHVVVTDDSDFSQGITYVGPHNMIRLWVVAPEDTSTLQDYDDWLAILFIHEYTHLLHLDQARGLPALVNAVLGDVFHPVQLNPTWLIEGYAVQAESALTTAGRVRGTMFDMYLRTAILEGTFLRLDQMTNGTRNFPSSNVPYLYGQDFIEYLAQRFGEESLWELGREMSDDVIVYGLNRNFRRVFGASAVDLWEDWRESLQVGYHAVAERLSEEGLTNSRQLTHWGESMGAPRFLPHDNRVVMYHAGEDRPKALWTVDATTEERRQLRPVPGPVSVAPSPEGRYLYLSRAERFNVVYTYHDVFRLDLESGEETQLTQGKRIFGLDMSPDGRHVVYTSYRADSSDLWVANRELASPRRLVASNPGEQFYGPRFSPDGQLVAVSRWRRGGYRDIVLVETETGRVRPVTNDRAIDSGPCFSPDGRWLLFASDRTGISNIYAVDLEEDRLWQVTNVLGGAFSPDLSHDGDQLAFMGFHSRGFDLHVMPFEPEQFREPQPQQRRPSDETNYPTPRHRQRPYRPWASLAPRNWMVGTTTDAFGQALLLSTFGNDATQAHGFQANVTVGLERGDVSYDLSYQLRLFRPNLTFRHSRSVTPRNNMRVDASSFSYIAETLQASADLSVPFVRGLAAHRLSLGYDVEHSRSLTDLHSLRWDPAGRPPRFPTLGLSSAVRLSWGYSNTRSSVRAISREQGRALSASLSVSHPALGADYIYVAFRYRWTEYILMPWLRHHVLALSLGGGISAGELNSSSFYLGGYAEQDVVNAFMEQRFLGGHHLRGYPPGVVNGKQYHLLNMEYRLPLWNAERGVYTLPIYLSHVWLAALCDVGGAFTENLNADELLVGTGGEVLLRVVVGYFIPITIRLSYAYGFMDGGDHMFQAVLGAPF
jgi:Tol biopolymer transport system component